MSNYLWLHALQHTRLFCSPLSTRICSISYTLNLWWYLTISSSSVPFSFCLQSFPSSESFLMSGLFTSVGQRNSPCNEYLELISQCRRCRFNPWVGKILWRRKWLPTLVYLPGESNGHRSLEVYTPWGLKESDMTDGITHTHWCFHFTKYTYYMVSQYSPLLFFSPPWL